MGSPELPPIKRRKAFSGNLLQSELHASTPPMPSLIERRSAYRNTIEARRGLGSPLRVK